MGDDFRMPPRSAGVLVLLSVLLVILIIIALAGRTDSPWSRPLAILLLAVAIAAFAWFLSSSRRTRFELSSQGLRIRQTAYGRTIPAASLKAREARLLDLARDRDYQPRWRTNGLGLPDYQLGWFRLRNKTKALLFVTDRDRVVLLPTSEGYSVLMSVSEPERFLRTLQERMR